MDFREGDSPTAAGSLGAGSALVAVLSLILVGLALGGHPLLDPNEAKHALVAAEMVASGHWLEPVLNGVPYHHKPALFYDLVGMMYRLLGVSETAARVVPALATCATLVLTYRFGARRGGGQGLLAAGLLASSIFFIQLGRFANLDALFTFALSGAVLTAARGERGCAVVTAARGQTDGALVVPWSAFVLAALAVLTKGPVAIVLLAPLVALAARDGGLDWRRFGLGAALTAALVGAWTLPTYIAHADYLREFLWTHNFARYFTPEEKFHEQPVYFFVPVLFAALLPWSVLLPRALYAAARDGRDLRLLATFSAWIFVFFSFSAGKLATYVVPAFPCLAVLVASWLSANGGRPVRQVAGELLGGLVPLALLAPIGAVAAVVAAPSLMPIAATLLPASSAAALAVAVARAGHSTNRVILLACGGCLLTTLALDAFGGRAVAALNSDRDLAQQALALGRPERLVVYRVRPFSFLFYTGWRAVYKVSDEEYRSALQKPGAWLLLTKEKRLEALAGVVPELAYRRAGANARHLLLAPESQHSR